jgi:hypothetical protein
MRLNDQIVRVARTLAARVDHEFGFSCECGCEGLVPLTVAERENGGAWMEGHRPA